MNRYAVSLLSFFLGAAFVIVVMAIPQPGVLRGSAIELAFGIALGWLSGLFAFAHRIWQKWLA